MKVTITHMKAPWPQGAKVGDVVEFAGAVPAWTVGKCTDAGDEATATVAYPMSDQEQARDDLAQRSAEMVDHFRKQAQAAIDAAADKHGDELKALRAELESGGQALQSALNENDNLRAQIAGVQERLDAATTKLAIPAVRSILEADDQATSERAAIASAASTSTSAAGKGGTGKGGGKGGS